MLYLVESFHDQDFAKEIFFFCKNANRCSKLDFSVYWDNLFSRSEKDILDLHGFKITIETNLETLFSAKRIVLSVFFERGFFSSDVSL